MYSLCIFHGSDYIYFYCYDAHLVLPGLPPTCPPARPADLTHRRTRWPVSEATRPHGLLSTSVRPPVRPVHAHRGMDRPLIGSSGRSGMRQSATLTRAEENTSELQSRMRISYAVFCSKKKNTLHIKT